MEANEATLLKHSVLLEMRRMENMEKRRPTKPNLSKAEWAAVKQLRDDLDVIIIPADKGDKTIRLDYGSAEGKSNDAADILDSGPSVLEIKSYLQKMKERIEPHSKLECDPAPKHKRKLNGALTKMKRKPQLDGKKKKEDADLLLLARANLEKFKTEGAVAPQLRGQLKDHKEGKPLREIANASHSPGHKLAKVLNKIFEPYTGKTETAVNGGKQLI
jgi:hypothetical protein